MRNEYAQSCAQSSASLPTALGAVYAQYGGMPTQEQIAFRDWIDLIVEKTNLPDPTAVARAAGLAPSTVNKPYTGNKNVKWEVSTKTIRKIAEATGVPPPKTLLPLPDPYKTVSSAGLDSRASVSQSRNVGLTKFNIGLKGGGAGRAMSDATLNKAIQRLIECNSWDAVFDAVMRAHIGESDDSGFTPTRHRGK